MTKQERLQILLSIRSVYQSGFGGILANGRIVDRRKFPHSAPINAFPQFGIPKSHKFPGDLTPMDTEIEPISLRKDFPNESISKIRCS